MKLTIDTDTIFWHSIRRWFWRWSIKGYGPDFRVPGRCADCGIPLTFAECTHYGTTCEQCEGIAHEKLDAALRSDAPPDLQPCNCRWRGEEVVQRCELHEAWREAIHDWADRAKAAEAALKDHP